MSNLLISRQILVPKDMYKCFKVWCSENLQKMNSIYDSMIEYFFNIFQGSKSEICFIASYRNGYPMTLWMSPESYKKIGELSQQYNVSDARILFTMLVHYLKEKKVFDYFKREI